MNSEKALELLKKMENSTMGNTVSYEKLLSRSSNIIFIPQLSHNDGYVVLEC